MSHSGCVDIKAPMRWPVTSKFQTSKWWSAQAWPDLTIEPLAMWVAQGTMATVSNNVSFQGSPWKSRVLSIATKQLLTGLALQASPSTFCTNPGSNYQSCKHGTGLSRCVEVMRLRREHKRGMLLPLRVMNRHHFNLVGFQKCWISNLTIRFDQFYDHERDHCVFDEVLTQRSRSASPKVMKLAPSRSQNRKILIIMVPWAPQSGAAHCPW